MPEIAKSRMNFGGRLCHESENLVDFMQIPIQF